MYKYIFIGKVICEVNICLNPQILQCQAVDAGFIFDTLTTCTNSELHIFVSNISGKQDFLELRNYVRDNTRILIDTLNYAWGTGYDVEISRCIDVSTGATIIIDERVPELSDRQDERPFPSEKVLALALNSQPLRLALANLREAVRMTGDTGFFCYRAIESIKQNFYAEQDGKDDKPSWNRLRDALRINRDWIDALTKHYEANNQRHGKSPYMLGESRVSAMLHAWKVVDRFCMYLDNGSKPLAQGIEELK